MTLLSHHTIAELSEWIHALDYEIRQIDAAFASSAVEWQARDPASCADWSSDWKALQARYRTARGCAVVAITLAKAMPVADAAIPAEDEWQGVLRAVSSTSGAVGKGDLQDLYGRLVAASGRPIDLSKMPQPHAADLDLDAYKAADVAVRAVEHAAHQLPVQRTGVFLAALLAAGLAGALVTLKAGAR